MSPRSYIYFLNQRGQLYHVYDVLGLVTRKTTPSGPASLRDHAFIDFFFQRLQPHETYQPQLCPTLSPPASPLPSTVLPAASISMSSSSSSSAYGQQQSFQQVLQRPWTAWDYFNAAGLQRQRHLTSSTSLLNVITTQERDENNKELTSTSHNTNSEMSKESGNDERIAEQIIHVCRPWFPYFSRCGNEHNLMIAEDAPIVFWDLQFRADSCSKHPPDEGGHGTAASDVSNLAVDRDAIMMKESTISPSSSSSHCSPETNQVAVVGVDLMFAGSMREPFVPSTLQCSRDGRLYHPVSQHHFIAKRAWNRVLQPPTDRDDNAARELHPPQQQKILGLVGSQVGLRLGLDFVCEDTTDDGRYQIEWLGKSYIIPFMDDAS